MTPLDKLSIIQDLTVVLLASGIIAILFQKRGWPKVIGYIVAGILMGLEPIQPFLFSSEHSEHVLAHLGVIFLMFTLGLELNIRKLRKIGNVVFPTALFDLVMMILLGYTVGVHIFHWSLLPSLFLGAAICDSSTTLLAKALNEIGCSREHFASVIFGTTISEDIITIGVMAILSGLLLTGKFQAMELLTQLIYLVLFLVGVMCFGLLLLPQFLNRLSRLKDDETLLIIILGICFGISYCAEKLNFSLALGAFLVGAVVSESKVSLRVHEKTEALRNMFSAVFFVTIGLMVNPKEMWECKWGILLLTLLVVIGKILNCAFFSFAMGQKRQDAIKTGIGLAQIGDFAYMVVLLGCNLTNNAAPYPKLYQMAVGTSIITTLLNPFILKKANSFITVIDKILPVKVLNLLDGYTTWCSQTRNHVKAGRLSKAFKRHVIFFTVDLTLMGVLFLVAHYLSQNTHFLHLLPGFFSVHATSILWSICSFFSLFITICAFLHSRSIGDELGHIATPGFLSPKASNIIHRQTQFIVIILCSLLILIEFTFLSNLLLANIWAMILTFVALVIICITYWKELKANALYCQQTLGNILEADASEIEQNAETNIYSQIAVPQNSGAIGKNLATLRLRNHTGAAITKIQKYNGKTVELPGPNDILDANDTLFLIATEEQWKKTKEFLVQETLPSDDTLQNLTNLLELHVDKLQLCDSAPAIGRTIKEMQLRNQTGATILCIEHQDNSIENNPAPDTHFQKEDTIYLLGNNQQISQANNILNSFQPNNL